MYTSITVGLTTCQWQSLEYIAEDPKDWFIGWAQGRADTAAKDIVRLYTDDKISLINKSKIMNGLADLQMMTSKERKIIKKSLKKSLTRIAFSM